MKKQFKNTRKENKAKGDKEKAGECTHSITVMDHCLCIFNSQMLTFDYFK